MNTISKKHMYYYHFVALCYKYTINPEVALENEDVVQAVLNDDSKEVERLLKEEF